MLPGMCPLLLPPAHLAPAAGRSDDDGVSTAVREMTDIDDLDVLDAEDPDAWVVRWWREVDRGSDDPYIHWFVGELDGEAVGFAAALRAPAARDGYGVGIVRVLSRARRRGVGSALLAAVEQAVRDAGLPGVLLSRREGSSAGRAAAEAWGLDEVARHRFSELDLTAVDRAAFAERASRPDVRMVALEPVEVAGEEPWRRLHGLLVLRYGEAPDSEGGGEAPPWEVFLRTAAVHDPWAAVVAEEAGEWVGLTVVSRRAGTDDTVNTFFTAVSSSHRGRGIATALKCRQALLMADAGITIVSTQNMDGNDAILAANRTLGFREAGGHVDVVRTFQGVREP